MTERETFEWCCTNSKPEINELGEYTNPYIQERWIGWQACFESYKNYIVIPYHQYG